jgi:predicted CopG family antitoxin
MGRMTTMKVDPEVWRELLLKKEPGESFNDVLREMLELDADEDEEEIIPGYDDEEDDEE